VSPLVHELLGPTGEFGFGEPRAIELEGISSRHRTFPSTPSWLDTYGVQDGVRLGDVLGGH
jgi:hypothetical protein